MSRVSRYWGYLHKNTILTKESRKIWASLINVSKTQNLNRMASNFLRSQRIPLLSSLWLRGRSCLALLPHFTFRWCCLWGFHKGKGKGASILLLPECGSWLWTASPLLTALVFISIHVSKGEETRRRIPIVTTGKEFWSQWVIFLEVSHDPQGREQNLYKKKVLWVGKAHSCSKSWRNSMNSVNTPALHSLETRQYEKKNSCQIWEKKQDRSQREQTEWVPQLPSLLSRKSTQATQTEWLVQLSWKTEGGQSS